MICRSVLHCWLYLFCSSDHTNHCSSVQRAVVTDMPFTLLPAGAGGDTHADAGHFALELRSVTFSDWREFAAAAAAAESNRNESRSPADPGGAALAEQLADALIIDDSARGGFCERVTRRLALSVAGAWVSPRTPLLTGLHDGAAAVADLFRVARQKLSESLVGVARQWDSIVSAAVDARRTTPASPRSRPAASAAAASSPLSTAPRLDHPAPAESAADATSSEYSCPSPDPSTSHGCRRASTRLRAGKLPLDLEAAPYVPLRHRHRDRLVSHLAGLHRELSLFDVGQSRSFSVRVLVR